MKFDDVRKHRGRLTRVAVDLGATELAVFWYVPDASNDPLYLLDHVRPDDSDEAVRRAAINSFRDLITPCVEQKRDGAFEVVPTSPAHPEPQYCLVKLARTSAGEVVGVAAFIVRRADQAGALASLATL
ncbi:MAG: hypothetical protein JWO31_3509 [Phycisphaerales bacterium]|nr:hypothetical protein [Phycisphaerales bacterium]